MITKVAKAQALREAFIEDLSGMYEQEEMNADITLDTSPIQENEIEEAEIINDNDTSGKTETADDIL